VGLDGQPVIGTKFIGYDKKKRGPVRIPTSEPTVVWNVRKNGRDILSDVGFLLITRRDRSLYLENNSTRMYATRIDYHARAVILWYVDIEPNRRSLLDLIRNVTDEKDRGRFYVTV